MNTGHKLWVSREGVLWEMELDSDENWMENCCLDMPLKVYVTIKAKWLTIAILKTNFNDHFGLQENLA